MLKKSSVLLLILIVLFSFTNVSFGLNNNEELNKGSLVIIGGALSRNNDEVYNKFIELAGGKENAKIGIIPAASGSPHKYTEMFKQDLIKYGICEENIIAIPIAVKNDKRSPDVDESTWSQNGNNIEVANLIKECTGIWFLGGDQLRITETLLKEDGSNTVALDAIWEIYKNGGVIGGTSAGAAIMSDVMIAGGDSLGSLLYGFTTEYDDSNLDQQNYGAAYVVKGLNFFKYGIIDQHFDRKARLGRLIIVGYKEKDKYPISYGVDENTALIFNNESKIIEVLGTGGVTIVDLSNATKNNTNLKADMKNIKISYIEKGDTYNVETNEFKINPDKLTTVGYEYMDIKDPMVTGVFSGNALTKKFIPYGLVDNAGANEVKSFCYDATGSGVALIFKQTEESEGYWGQDGPADLYSFTNVVLDIKPIIVDMKYDDGSGSPLHSDKTDVEIITYIVQPGDVLWKIANKFKVDLNTLIELNNLKNPNLLQKGQKLIIPK